MELTWNQFSTQYGEAEVTFKSYYKHVFSFEGEFNEDSVYVAVGGDGGSIYRVDVEANVRYKVKDLGGLFASITGKDGNRKATFRDD